MKILLHNYTFSGAPLPWLTVWLCGAAGAAAVIVLNQISVQKIDSTARAG
jgi:hypothetical protein